MIILSLIEESQEKTNKELEEEMREELTGTVFPWCKGIEKIKVIEE